MFEGAPDRPRHLAEQLVSVGSAVVAEERGAPAINGGMRREWFGETFEVRPILRRVGKRMGAGKVRYISGAKAGRRMVDTDVADKVKRSGAAGKLGNRHVIAEAIPRPGKSPRARRDFELRFNDLLIVIVARTQHHPVLAECDRPLVVICRLVPDAENRHCHPIVMDLLATCIANEIICTTCISRTRCDCESACALEA